MLAVSTFVFAPEVTKTIQTALINVLPGGAGKELVTTIDTQLETGGGPLFILGLLGSFWIGSRLFITMEDCFGIIYRLPSRGFIRQNAMAIGMSVFYVVVVPLVF